MEEFKEENIDELEYLISLKTASKNDVARMNNFMSRFIDPKCHVCPTCTSQIRFAWNRICMWGAHKADFISEYKSKLQNPLPEKEENITIDIIVPSIKQICGCGKEIKDRRYKRCSYCNSII